MENAQKKREIHGNGSSSESHSPLVMYQFTGLPGGGVYIRTYEAKKFYRMIWYEERGRICNYTIRSENRKIQYLICSISPILEIL